jgi:hypothetical protein
LEAPASWRGTGSGVRGCLLNPLAKDVLWHIPAHSPVARTVRLFSARGGVEKKQTKVTHICRSPKTKAVTYFILF